MRQVHSLYSGQRRLHRESIVKRQTPLTTTETAKAEAPCRNPEPEIGRDGGLYGSAKLPVGHGSSYELRDLLKPESRNRTRKAKRARLQYKSEPVESVAVVPDKLDAPAKATEQRRDEPVDNLGILDLINAALREKARTARSTRLRPRRTASTMARRLVATSTCSRRSSSPICAR